MDKYCENCQHLVPGQQCGLDWDKKIFLDSTCDDFKGLEDESLSKSEILKLLKEIVDDDRFVTGNDDQEYDIAVNSAYENALDTIKLILQKND